MPGEYPHRLLRVDGQLPEAVTDRLSEQNRAPAEDMEMAITSMLPVQRAFVALLLPELNDEQQSECAVAWCELTLRLFAEQGLKRLPSFPQVIHADTFVRASRLLREAGFDGSEPTSSLVRFLRDQRIKRSAEWVRKNRSELFSATL